MSNKIPCVAALAGVMLSPVAMADWIGDSKASVQTRSFYLNRDWRSGSGPSKAEDWAQGFIFNYASGYTGGVVGLGLDVTGMLGVKLTSDDVQGTSLLPDKGDGVADDYSKVSAALKLKYSRTELKLGGGLMLKSPVLISGDLRLLPQTFNGALLSSSQIEGLTLTAGQFREVVERNGSGRRDIRANNYAAFEGGDFNFAGAEYAFGQQRTQLGGWYAELQDIYQQYNLNASHRLQWQDWSLTGAVSYFDSREDGRQLAGRIDNQLAMFSLTAAHGPHSWRIGYQRNRGDSAFPSIYESNGYMFNVMQILDFSRAEERSWQARYDFDFAAVGIPGLGAFVRYGRGDGFKVAGASAREHERDLDVRYVVQSGPLKNLSLHWRNASLRSDAMRDIDENRLILAYTLQLL